MQNVTVELTDILAHLRINQADVIADHIENFVDSAVRGMDFRDTVNLERMVSDQIMKYALKYSNHKVPPPLFTATNAIFSSDFVFSEAVGFLLVRQFDFDIVLEDMPIISGEEDFELLA